MFRLMSSVQNKRRGSILVLSAFLMVIMLGMVAFALDVGVMMLTKTQLQVAADAAAMAAGAVLGAPDADPAAVAKQFAALHKANGKSIQLANADIQNGTWDATTRTFTPSAEVSNAIKITARANDTTGGNGLYFARIFGVNTMNMSASAVAMGNPRDICFVMDLSGSMNNDTEPAWKTAEINSDYGNGLGDQLMQQLYTDLGYGTYPGVLQHVGQPLGVVQDNRAYARLTSNNGPLRNNGIHTNYRINTNDNEATRKQKAYRWMIDNQIAVTMPGVTPPANWNTHYNYWAAYLDYIMSRETVNSGAGTPPNNRGTLPPNQNSDRMSSLNSGASSYNNKIGYLTYVQFMADMGRDERPDGVNYTPMAVSSPYCIRHQESVGGTTFNFPPGEQPLHATRRSLISAMQVVAERNASVPDSNLRDWVSVVTFDTVAGTVLALPLTSDYTAAMNLARDMQCVYDGNASTATETGLIAARNHIKPSNQGGSGRLYTNKVVVLATDGMANLRTSSNNTISTYRAANASSNWYGGSDYNADAALMQSAMMQGDKWRVFSIAFGTDANFDFMDRLARMGGTADDNGLAPRTSGNPGLIEAELSDIFKQIITTPAVRLVQ